MHINNRTKGNYHKSVVGFFKKNQGQAIEHCYDGRNEFSKVLCGWISNEVSQIIDRTVRFFYEVNKLGIN